MILSHGSVRIRKAVLSDVDHIAGKLRDSDIVEVKASHGFEPREAVFDAFTRSTFCATLVAFGRPTVIFGVVPDSPPSDWASIWSLGTRDISKVRLAFLKVSKPMIELMLGYYPLLYNYVDDRNKDSIKWLRWCGARMFEAEPYGVAGEPFRKFVFQRSAYV